jgi:hypothetical protein
MRNLKNFTISCHECGGNHAGVQVDDEAPYQAGIVVCPDCAEVEVLFEIQVVPPS